MAALVLAGTSRYGSTEMTWSKQKKLTGVCLFKGAGLLVSLCGSGLSVIFVSNIVVGNASLAYASVPFVQMVRCTIPAMTAGANMLLFKHTFSTRQTLALAAIVFGAVLVCRGEVRIFGD